MKRDLSGLYTASRRNKSTGRLEYRVAGRWLSRQRVWQVANVEAGLCQCGGEIMYGAARCRRCLDGNRARMQAAGSVPWTKGGMGRPPLKRSR